MKVKISFISGEKNKQTFQPTQYLDSTRGWGSGNGSDEGGDEALPESEMGEAAIPQNAHGWAAPSLTLRPSCSLQGKST